jgi:hypothetical protein
VTSLAAKVDRTVAPHWAVRREEQAGGLDRPGERLLERRQADIDDLFHGDS